VEDELPLQVRGNRKVEDIVHSTEMVNLWVSDKGYIQLAMRTGQYKNLNTGSIYEGIKVTSDILTGDLKFSGEATSDKVQGYFAYFELLNGFKKSIYMTKEEVIRHAKRYSKSYAYESSAWHTNFDEMAQKTVMRKLLSHFGYLTPDMVAALSTDKDDDVDIRVADEKAENANQEPIDIEQEPEEKEEPKQQAKPKEQKDKSEPEQVKMEGPEF
jgi:recombination protein RecT